MKKIIAEYVIGDGRHLKYLYDLENMNDCNHFFDGEDCLERVFLWTEKGLSEEDYREIPVEEAKKMVLDAMSAYSGNP